MNNLLHTIKQYIFQGLKIAVPVVGGFVFSQCDSNTNTKKQNTKEFEPYYILAGTDNKDRTIHIGAIGRKISENTKVYSIKIEKDSSILEARLGKRIKTGPITHTKYPIVNLKDTEFSMNPKSYTVNIKKLRFISPTDTIKQYGTEANSPENKLYIAQALKAADSLYAVKTKEQQRLVRSIK